MNCRFVFQTATVVFHKTKALMRASGYIRLNCCCVIEGSSMKKSPLMCFTNEQDFISLEASVLRPVLFVALHRMNVA